jgi:hypothetical protein
LLTQSPCDAGRKTLVRRRRCRVGRSWSPWCRHRDRRRRDTLTPPWPGECPVASGRGGASVASVRMRKTRYSNVTRAAAYAACKVGPPHHPAQASDVRPRMSHRAHVGARRSAVGGGERSCRARRRARVGSCGSGWRLHRQRPGAEMHVLRRHLDHCLRGRGGWARPSPGSSCSSPGSFGGSCPQASQACTAGRPEGSAAEHEPAEPPACTAAGQHHRTPEPSATGSGGPAAPAAAAAALPEPLPAAARSATDLPGKRRPSPVEIMSTGRPRTAHANAAGKPSLQIPAAADHALASRHRRGSHGLRCKHTCRHCTRTPQGATHNRNGPEGPEVLHQQPACKTRANRRPSDEDHGAHLQTCLRGPGAASGARRTTASEPSALLAESQSLPPGTTRLCLPPQSPLRAGLRQEIRRIGEATTVATSDGKAPTPTTGHWKRVGCLDASHTRCFRATHTHTCHHWPSTSVPPPGEGPANGPRRPRWPNDQGHAALQGAAPRQWTWIEEGKERVGPGTTKA